MSSRVRFANQLRGLAALSVAASHLIGVFWVLPGVVTAVTFSPPQTGPAPGVLALVSRTWFNFGPFGVAVFFLISGFVIPFSLEKHSRAGFAVARLLRIYPTYVAAFLLQMAILYAASVIWDRPFTHAPAVILTNALLIYDLVGHPSLDLVNWTLSVELKFYLLAIVLASAIRRARVALLILASVMAVALNGLMTAGVLGDIAAPASTVSYTASSHSVCLAFMLVGVAFNFHLRRLISTGTLIATVTVLTGLFIAAWRWSVWGGQYPIVTVNYLYAIVLFTALYIIRNHVPANPILDAMADVSFPFYLIHSLLGYSLMRALMVGAQLDFYSALLFTLPTLLLCSAGLHMAIEKPSVAFGRRIA